MRHAWEIVGYVSLDGLVCRNCWDIDPGGHDAPPVFLCDDGAKEKCGDCGERLDGDDGTEATQGET
jgi:hypothetical protein